VQGGRPERRGDRLRGRAREQRLPRLHRQRGTCLDQFLFDFSTRTGIYLCAAPFLSGSCDVSAGCAQDCETQGCSACVEETCDTTAQAGECSQFFGPADQCIASSMAATALCASASYANFGAWLQGVGAHYCK
jgi:hypothetical protein